MPNATLIKPLLQSSVHKTKLISKATAEIYGNRNHVGLFLRLRLQRPTLSIVRLRTELAKLSKFITLSNTMLYANVAELCREIYYIRIVCRNYDEVWIELYLWRKESPWSFIYLFKGFFFIVWNSHGFAALEQTFIRLVSTKNQTCFLKPSLVTLNSLGESSLFQMVIKLYTTELSPPVRAVIMACDIFNVTFENVEVNLMDKEQLQPEFLTKNPLHTVPVFEDDDFILHDSHAILMYLADAYGKDEAWYPKDEKMRSLINQKLFFDSSILFPRLKNVTYALVIERKKTLKQKWLDSIEDGYGFMEQFLSRTAFIASDHITIADLSVYSNMSSLAQIVPVDQIKYPKTYAWCDVMEKKPYCQKHNNPGAVTLGGLLRQCRESTSN